MIYRIIIQLAAGDAFVPKKSLLRKWAKKALCNNINAAEVTIRVVDTDEISALNTTYRHKAGPTNVLSFPFDAPKEVDICSAIPILGDIVICADVVNNEAQAQDKANLAHWAHMVVHGIFHLLGYDHETDHEAEEMEAMEVSILQTLGFSNPYHTGKTR